MNLQKNIKAKYRLLVFLPVGLCCLILFFFGYEHFFGNKAEAKFHKIFTNLKAYNPRLLCGYGWNSEELTSAPWFYDAYYSVDNNPNLISGIKTMAAHNGYNLRPDKSTIKSMQGLKGYDTQTYLIAYKGTTTLEVDIAQHGESLDDLCTGSSSYGQQFKPEPGKALIEFDYSLG